MTCGALLLIIAVLLVGHVVAATIVRNVEHDRYAALDAVARLFNMDGEQNVPAWYSASVLLACAGLALLVGLAGRGADARLRSHWFGLAALLTFLSVDEAVAIHEGLASPLTDSLDLERDRWRNWAWVLPYSLFAVVFALVSIPFLRALPRSTAKGLVVAGALFVTGAVGLELIGAQAYGDFGDSTGYLALVAAEETIEMVAVVVLVFTLLCHLRDHVGPVRVAWSREWINPR